jgi:hypothetical protein
MAPNKPDYITQMTTNVANFNHYQEEHDNALTTIPYSKSMKMCRSAGQLPAFHGALRFITSMLATTPYPQQSESNPHPYTLLL